MKLERVTITGADDRVNHDEIIKISRKYPFVEWGILFSPSRIGQQRYPSFDWIKVLKYKTEAETSLEQKIKFSAHLCGDYTKEILETGDDPLVHQNKNFQEIGDLFKRIQLNFNASKNSVCEGFYNFIKQCDTDRFIIQINKANRKVCGEIINRKLPADFLWDSSGGRGVANDQDWSPPLINHFTGYAGGLNPDNLKEKLDKFSKQESPTQNFEIWIDVESGVRTDDQFDLDKVIKFLKVASRYTLKN